MAACCVPISEIANKTLEVFLVRLQVEKQNSMFMSSIHVEGAHSGGLTSALFDAWADKERRNLLDSLIVREASR